MDSQASLIPETIAATAKVRRRHGRILEKLGPAPEFALRAMGDYGLDDDEIARYFKMTVSSVRRVRLVLRVDESST